MDAPLRPGPRTGLLERDRELHALDAAIATASGGTGTFVVVEGPPGAGKTAILATARRRAGAAGMLVAHARASTLEQRFAFAVARQILDPHLRRAGSAELDVLMGGSPACAGPVAPDFEVLHALFWLAADLAASSPLLIAVDDLHWCDDASLRWLAFLAPRIEGLPMLVVAGAHADDPSAGSEVLEEAIAHAQVMRPPPLSPAAVAQLVRERHAADDDFCAQCHATTDGNPLLVHELLAALDADDLRPRSDRLAHLSSIGAHAVAHRMRLRIARLAPDAAALAAAVAVLGDGTTMNHAAALAELDDGAAAAAATTLARAGILRRDSPPSFAHPLERAALYMTIPALEREALHAQAARMLAAEGAAAKRVAAHLLHAPSRHEDFAVASLRDAARVAMGHGDAELAVACLRRALCEPLAPSARGEVLIELAVAEKLVDLPACAEHFLEARALLGDDVRCAQIGLQLARTLFLAGRSEEAIGALQDARGLPGPCSRDLTRQLRAELVGVTMLRPDLYSIAAQELRAFERKPPDAGAGARMVLAMTAYHDARRGRGRMSCAERARQALAGSTLLDEDPGSAFAYACRVLVVADHFEAAAAAYERALERARRRGAKTSYAVDLAFRAGLAIHRGALAEAESDARGALDAALAGGVATALPFSLTYLALTLLEQGELEAAGSALDQCVAHAAAGGELPLFQLVSGRLQRATGDAGGALATILQAATGYAATGQDNPALAGWRSEAALARLELGDGDSARELATEEVRLARAWGAPRALGRALRVSGLAEGGERGLGLLREALVMLSRSPARLERAKTLVELGAAVRRSGRRSEARTHLSRGLDLADGCGARPLAELARSELRAAGARPRRARLMGIQSLTPSEQRIATMAADGMTNRAIGQALFVTAKTVEAHLSSTYRKLDIGSRLELRQALAHPAGRQRGAPDSARGQQGLACGPAPQR
jgi:DNA-binding CsgD family transcriptional regulator